jgi:hypothetical protein
MSTGILANHQTNDLQQHLGSRLSLNKFRGSVKYVGPVDNTSGVWLGVEWDDPGRGKHDGKGYFRTGQVFLYNGPIEALFVSLNLNQRTQGRLIHQVDGKHKLGMLSRGRAT